MAVTIIFDKPVNVDHLVNELALAGFFRTSFRLNEFITVEDSNDEIAVRAVYDAHDASALTPGEQDEITAANSKVAFRNLPDWATYTADEATAAITNAIFNGQTQAQVEAAITTAITNAPNTIAGLKTVMGQLFIQAADQIITMRGILVIMGKMLVWLRDVVIRRA